MKKLITIALALTLLVSLVVLVACSTSGAIVGKFFGSITVLSASPPDTTTVAGNIMAVFYAKADGLFLFWCTDATIVDNGDGTWDVTSPQVIASDVDQDTVDYGLYRYQEIVVPSGGIGPEPVYIADLNLQPVTADDLPRSMHVAALKSVALVDGSPRATVYRLYMGVAYEVLNCRVAQSAYDAYTSAKLKVYDPIYDWQALQNKDCFVLVYFISETPYNNEVQIPVIVDKVIK